MPFSKDFFPPLLNYLVIDLSQHLLVLTLTFRSEILPFSTNISISFISKPSQTNFLQLYTPFRALLLCTCCLPVVISAYVFNIAGRLYEFGGVCCVLYDAGDFLVCGWLAGFIAFCSLLLLLHHLSYRKLLSFHI